MPKNLTRILSGSFPSFIIFTLVSLLFVFSCKSDKKDTNPVDLFEGPNSINFTMEGKQLAGSDQIGKDLTMLDYQEDRSNKDHVIHVPINDSVYFKDVSQFKGDPPGARQWYIDEQKLESNGKEVAFFSEEVGPTIVTLKFDDYNYVMKGVYFTDEFSFSEGMEDPEEVEEIDSDQSLADATASNYDEPTQSASKPVEQPRVAEKPRNVEQTRAVEKQPAVSKPAPVEKTVQKRPPPPPPVKREITKVDFSANKTSVETGEKISFRDLSEPGVAINQRVWDWGDGSTTPTRGVTAGYSYFKPGTYTVKLCLNYSNKCSSKKITVKEKEKAIVAPPPPPKKEPVKVEVKEIPVSKVVISSASKTLVGKPIEISDGSYPMDAVKARTWYVNGEKTNITKKRFSKTFDKAGKYTIKLCVNGTTLCESKMISIEDKPKPPPPPPVKKATTTTTKTAPVEEFFPMANSKTGLRSSQRCPDADSKWHDGESELVITPTVQMELLNARIYGQKVAQATVTLKSSDGKVKRTINNVQILPGPSTIEFGDFGVVLSPGTKYTITITPKSGETLSLDNGGACNTSFAADDRLGVSYKDNVMTLYDIKFSY